MSQTTTTLLSRELNRGIMSRGERYSVLASEERRLALGVLAEQPTGVGLKQLAAKIVTEREGEESQDADSIKEVMIVLHHVHLPKMADMGIVRYDTETQEIKPAAGSIYDRGYQ